MAGPDSNPQVQVAAAAVIFFICALFILWRTNRAVDEWVKARFKQLFVREKKKARIRPKGETGMAQATTTLDLNRETRAQKAILSLQRADPEMAMIEEGLGPGPRGLLGQQEAR